MSKLGDLQKMQGHLLCWVAHNMPDISAEIRRSVTEIHEGNVYVWVDLPDVQKVFTNHNATVIAQQWAGLCHHFKTESHLFIQSNN